MVDDEVDVGRAVLGCGFLDRDKVLPEITNGLDHTAGAVVRPEGAGVLDRNPPGQSARVGATGVYPRSILGGAFSIVEWRLEVVGEVGVILDRVLKGQILQILWG